MRPADITHLEELVVRTFTDLPVWGRGLLLSPSGDEIEMVSRRFPTWNFDVCTIADWDLRHSAPRRFTDYDAAFMCNMFMYSTDAEAWLRNVMAVTANLFVQDLIRGCRGPEELGDDGDMMRYELPSLGEFARLRNGFDFESLVSRNGCKINDVLVYSDTGSADGKDCRKFVALICR